jgi:NADPH-dependent 2,4-dienoyl-CoA reductase/sulfur reductase-like enzyme
VTARAVIIGASHAGAQVAASLRQLKWDGEVVLIGDEAALPYQRPPLSKAYLAGEREAGRRDPYRHADANAPCSSTAPLRIRAVVCGRS